MDALEEAVEYLRADQKRAEETWTYREVLSALLSHLQDLITAGDSRQEATTISRGLENCLHITRLCSERDSSLVGVANSLEQLIFRITAARTIRTETVEEALETLALEIDLCMSRE